MDTSKFFKSVEIVDENKYPKLYEDLELSPQCAAGDIRDSFKKLVLEKHPDKGGSNEEMWRVRYAYEILSDPEKRFIYDTTGSTKHIDDSVFVYKTYKKLNSILSIWFRVWVETKLNVKDIIIGFATNSNNPSKLGFFHVGGFNFIHYLVEDRISKILDVKERGSNNFISEIIATIVAAPFELMAYNAYKAGFLIIYLRNYFIFDKGDLNIINFIKSSIIAYKDCFKISWRQILGMVAFRIGFNLLQYLFVSFADYANHQYLLLKDKEDREAEEIESEDEQNGVTSTKNQNASRFWFFISRLSTASSYIVPSILFSVHRLFYKLENPKSINYFSKSLVKTGIAEGIFTFGIDQIILFTHRSTTRLLNGVRGLLSTIITNNNTNNNFNN